MRKTVSGITLMLLIINVFMATFDILPVWVNVNVTKSSDSNVTRHLTDEEDLLFSTRPYEKSWDFNKADEWGNFAKVNGDPMEIIIGINYAKSGAYEQLEQFIYENHAELVGKVSMNGKAIAAVAKVSLAAISSFAERVRASGLSKYIEPNLRFQVSFVPNDPYWPQQWGPVKIESDSAWNITMGEPSVLVAVVDTGIDWNHPDLVANYDASGYDWVNGDNDPMDDNGHGTHSAGIIAAVINNGIGIAGLAHVRIMAEKSLNWLGEGYVNDLANGVIHATNQGANIISISWGGPYHSELLYEAIKYAHNSGVLIVAAAGNENTDLKQYPAAYKEVIAVTATDQNDKPASFTNHGNWVEVAAPGVDIYSTIWDDSYALKSGTSMSAPHVAGVAALIWGRFPIMARDQVRAQLRYTAVDLGDPGFDVYYGYGRINARRSVEQGLPEHDILIFDLEAPQFLQLNATTVIGTAVLNFGVTNESNVAIQNFINGTLVSSSNISFMKSGALAVVNFSWTPTVEGIYNVTSCVMPVPNETIKENNALSKYVVVRTLKVPEKYSTIQEAINSAFPGETIFVSSGVYNENLVVNRTVSLIGENKSNTVIDGNGTGIVVSVVVDYVNVSGFLIQNGDFAGIAVYSGNNWIAENTIRANKVNGVFLNSLTRSSTIADNVITSNTNGILIESVWEGSYISGNVVTNNTNGIVLRDSMFLTFRNNEISSNGYNLVVEPAWLMPPADAYEYFHDIDISNTVDGKPIYYWINEHDKQIPADAGYVALINCIRITVENLNLTRNSQGVLLALTTNSIIKEVNASDNYWSGISLEFGSTQNYVIHNRVDRTNKSVVLGAGIQLAWDSGHNKIVNNTITCGDNGIEVGSSENEITGNVILDNEIWGIHIWGNDNVLRYNNMTNNTYNFGLESFIQDIDTSNTLNGKPIYYWINQHNAQIPPDAGYIAIVNSTNITVKNLNLTNNHEGILIAHSNNTLIRNVKISIVNYGVRIYSSHHNNITFTTIMNSGKGISLETSNNNTIIDNAILNSSFGIFLRESIYNLIRGNTIVAYQSGVDIEDSHNNRICQNSISKSRYAISICGSHNNVIETNLVINNYIGISIYDSHENIVLSNTIELSGYYGIYFCRSINNVIYHNNFINNTNQVFNREENVFDNSYPSGGNYWSDYTGIDLYSGPYQNETGSDGIGDTPYVIDADNRDRYPLMKPWTHLIGDVNGDGKVDIKDLVLFIKAFGSYPTHPRWNPDADFNNDSKIDIKDLVLVIKHFGEHDP